jgi:alanine racemase
LLCEHASAVSSDLGEPLLHCANSAAALRFPQTRYDLIRPGIALYGYPPAQCGGTESLRPALSVYALVTQVKTINAGDTIGYGRQWTARRRTRVASIAAGYADGVDRRNGNRGAVIAAGALCPIIGAIAMDQLSIDISDAGDLRLGEPVTLLGQEGDLRLDAVTVATSIGTIAYDLLSRLSSRVPRIPVAACET